MARSKFSIGCLVLLTASLLFGFGCATSRKLTVESIPEGASVFVNGQEVGSTPFSWDVDFADKNTRFQLIVRKHPDYEEIRKTIDEQEAKLARDPWVLSFPLEPLRSIVNVEFSSIPEGAFVAVDEEQPVRTPARVPVKFVRTSSRAPWSVPKVEFTLENYKPETRTLSYESTSKDLIFPAVLLELVRKEVGVTIATNVEGANITVNGEPMGKTPMPLSLVYTRPDGNSEWNKFFLEVQKDGYENVPPGDEAHPSFTRTLALHEALGLPGGRIFVRLDPIRFVKNVITEFIMTPQGVELGKRSELSQVGEIEKEPKVRSVTQITDADPTNPFVESRISVMPAGDQIVYSYPVRDARKTSPVGANIWMKRGNAAVRMTDGDFFDIEPTVTVDGKWIYFSSNRLGRMNIWRIQTQGKGGLTKITDSPSSLSDTEVSVSPKGDRIAYTSLLSGSNASQIWFANMDGTLPTQIRVGRSPVWSPDGKRVAYVAPDPISNRDKIWVMDADGGNPTQLTSGSDSHERYPAWSPDGRQIIYASNRALNEARKQNFDIWVMYADGSGHTQLTVNGSYDSRPAVSPDGRYVYFFSNRGAKRENQETLQIWRIEF